MDERVNEMKCNTSDSDGYIVVLQEHWITNDEIFLALISQAEFGQVVTSGFKPRIIVTPINY